MRETPPGEVYGAFDKTDLRAVFNAADDWFDANAAAMNLAIPLPQRTELTAAQKARIFSDVMTKRGKTGA